MPCCDPRGCSAHKTATRNPDGCQQEDSGLTFLFLHTPAPALQQNYSTLLLLCFCNISHSYFSELLNLYLEHIQLRNGDILLNLLTILRLLKGSILATLANLSQREREMPNCSIQIEFCLKIHFQVIFFIWLLWFMKNVSCLSINERILCLPQLIQVFWFYTLFCTFKINHSALDFSLIHHCYSWIDFCHLQAFLQLLDILHYQIKLKKTIYCVNISKSHHKLCLHSC